MTDVNDTAPELDSAALIAHLEAHGVRYLRAVTATQIAEPLAPGDLIVALARHAEPRFRQALIPLFLRHPDYAQYVSELVDALEPPPAETLRHMYTAAVYLQRMWRGVLGLYLGDLPLLPDYFGAHDYGLPGPDDRFGKAGLYALADTFEARTGDSWLTMYQKTMSLFLNQLGLEPTIDVAYAR